MVKYDGDAGVFKGITEIAPFVANL